MCKSQFGVVTVFFCLYLVGGSSLSSFMKNLLLETILEDEKIYLTITCHGVNYRFDNNGSISSCNQFGVGVGHSTRTILVSMYSTMEQISEQIAKPGMYML